MTHPLRFIFGLHLHQPVGNFDHVFAEHFERVYRPLLERLAERQFFPAVLHLSGPLIEWLEQHESAYLDRLGRLAADGHVELLAAGWHEPVLAALVRRDRIEQVQWMRERLRARFGVDARGLWLTERVWMPELAADLAHAGIESVLVDDRHFLVAGFERNALHAPFITESDDQRLALFPIDERLRYLIPFRPPEETAEYLRRLRADGRRLAVLADDGEKFGGWPGTYEWVYEREWITRFLDSMLDLTARGEMQLSTLRDALTAVPGGGLAYLPTASYREMEAWSLPPGPADRLARLEHDLGEERMSGPDGPLVRGSHWLNFLAKYSESNRMHKKAQRLSMLCRERGDPPEAREAIGRAQCNDAYWHGVFGGLYLPHLREAIWRNLSEAEGRLRAGEPLVVESLDLDADGQPELWIHSGDFSAIVSPHRGGAVEELTRFETGINYADVLTRRLEAYHLAALRPPDGGADEGGTASIHDIERSLRMAEPPPVDRHDRALFRERVLDGETTAEAYARATYTPRRTWEAAPLGVESAVSPGGAVVTLVATDASLRKTIRFTSAGSITVEYDWLADAEPDGVFAVELSLFRPLRIAATPEAEIWRYPVETVSKSERGLDRTVQGESITFRWPASLRHATLELGG
ncbi:MAG TPA: alpha-amylase/4-alpha-glucanotransferase domain-containing protein [Gemmatimonadales bacterium]|nr:alpha-amylase/4-alpha-glucanotransferase domain-containing protein [Gemmatimonadales bacterium]